MYEQRFNPYAANVDIVKGYLKSGKVLFLGILYLLSLCVSVITTLTASDSLASDVIDALRAVGFGDIRMDSDYYAQMANSVTVSTISSMTISSVITLLAVLGFILMFAKSRSANPDSTPSAGAAILHVLGVISFISAIILTVCGVLVLALGFVFYQDIADLIYRDPSLVLGILIGLSVVFAIFAFLLIFYTASYKNLYRSIKRSVNSVELQSKGAVAYGVFNILSAIMLGISLIGSVVLLITDSGLASLLSLISTLLLFVIAIVNASFALGYNRYIKRHKRGYRTPYSDGSNNAYAPGGYNAPNYSTDQNRYDDSYRSYSAPQQSAPSYNDNFSDYDLPQSKVAYCPNCGAPADGSSPFCSNCGYKM